MSLDWTMVVLRTVGFGGTLMRGKGEGETERGRERERVIVQPVFATSNSLFTPWLSITCRRNKALSPTAAALPPIMWGGPGHSVYWNGNARVESSSESLSHKTAFINCSHFLVFFFDSGLPFYQNTFCTNCTGNGGRCSFWFQLSDWSLEAGLCALFRVHEPTQRRVNKKMN